MKFAAVGHVTNDHLVGGVVVPGGSALYSSVAAAYLGAHAHIVTACAADFVGRDLLAAAGVTVEERASAATTTFQNSYRDGQRSARLLAHAEPLDRVEVDADLVFACPVAGEVGALPIGAALIAAGLQGWLRSFAEDGTVGRFYDVEPETWDGCRVAFVSDEDLGDAAELFLPALAAVVPVVVCTQGAAGARVYTRAGETRVAPRRAHEVDPTGAGDVFATAFLIALSHGASLVEAGNLAAHAGAIAVEGVGAASLSRLASLRP